MASGWQLAASAVLDTVAIVVALRLPRRQPRRLGNVWIAAGCAFLVTSVYLIVSRLPIDSAWLQTGLELVILAIGAALVVVFRLEPFGLAAGAIVSYFWRGLTRAVPLGSAATIKQAVLVFLVLGALIAAVILHGRTVADPAEPSSRGPNPRKGALSR